MSITQNDSRHFSGVFKSNFPRCDTQSEESKTTDAHVVVHHLRLGMLHNVHLSYSFSLTSLNCSTMRTDYIANVYIRQLLLSLARRSVAFIISNSVFGNDAIRAAAAAAAAVVASVRVQCARK